MTNLPAVRDGSADVVPAGYEPLDVTPPGRLPTEGEYNMMLMIANTAIASVQGVDDNQRILPKSIQSKEQAMMIMLAGFEIGMPPITATRRIFIVGGKTELETQALMGLVRAGDPTARFVFHRYDNDGVTVELFRQGESCIKVSYDLGDIKRSHQGQRAVIDWSKTNKKGERGKNDNGRYIFKFDNDGNRIYEEDPDSPWTKWRRDMLAYNAVKRACRLGAPDLTNQIGAVGAGVNRRIEISETARSGGDEDGRPINPVAGALASGEVSPQAVFRESEPEPSDYDPAPEPEGDPDGADLSPDAGSDEPQRDQAADDGPPDPRVVAEIENVMKELRSSWPTKDYRELFEACKKWTPDESTFKPAAIKTAAIAAECLAHVRQARGDPG